MLTGFGEAEDIDGSTGTCTNQNLPRRENGGKLIGGWVGV